MITTTLKNISIITNGLFLYKKNLTVNKIVIDSRNVIPGCLFIAIIGKNFDGHSFYQESIKRGCIAILVQKKLPIVFPQIIVNNTILALSKIAAWNRLQVHPLTIAITGSTGKTSVKEMISSIISIYNKTLFTQGNFNNIIGVSLTLLKLNITYKFLIIEIGANKPGEISYLTKIVKPHIILINNIHPVHLQGFHSILGVSKAKQEMLSALNKNGIALLNADSNNLELWKNDLKHKKHYFFSTKKKLIFSHLI